MANNDELMLEALGEAQTEISDICDVDVETLKDHLGNANISESVTDFVANIDSALDTLEQIKNDLLEQRAAMKTWVAPGRKGNQA